MPKVRVNGVTLSYQITDFTKPWEPFKGDVLMLHGWMGCKETFVNQVPDLARDFRVITVDMRGFGEASKPKRGYAPEIFAEDLKALLDHLSVAGVHLLGYSFGGMVAQQFVLTYPERVLSLILWATRSKPTGIFKAEEVARWLDKKSMEEFAQAFSEAFSDPFKPEVTEWTRSLIARGSKVGARNSLLAFANYDVFSRLKEIKVPTLLLASQEDKLIPFESMVEMANQIEGSELFVFEGSHGAYLKNPDKCNEAIREFLLKQVEKSHE